MRTHTAECTVRLQQRHHGSARGYEQARPHCGQNAGRHTLGFGRNWLILESPIVANATTVPEFWRWELNTLLFPFAVSSADRAIFQ
jgi:hypothetical protein